jgi:large subunit ribosomal protein L15
MGTELHTLKPPAGARKKRKRIGRGPGSGTGKTSGRGMKGQKARNNLIPQFEGGQLPIMRRVPKRGFVNIFRVEVHGINLERIEGAYSDGDVVDIESIRAKGLVPKKATIIKLLGTGEITKKVTVKVHRASKSAQAKLEAAGGTLELVPERPAKTE